LKQARVFPIRRSAPISPLKFGGLFAIGIILPVAGVLDAIWMLMR